MKSFNEANKLFQIESFDLYIDILGVSEYAGIGT